MQKYCSSFGKYFQGEMVSEEEGGGRRCFQVLEFRVSHGQAGGFFTREAQEGFALWCRLALETFSHVPFPPFVCRKLHALV
jgi:hypothetical protein